MPEFQEIEKVIIFKLKFLVLDTIVYIHNLITNIFKITQWYS